MKNLYFKSTSRGNDKFNFISNLNILNKIKYKFDMSKASKGKSKSSGKFRI